MFGRHVRAFFSACVSIRVTKFIGVIASIIANVTTCNTAAKASLVANFAVSVITCMVLKATFVAGVAVHCVTSLVTSVVVAGCGGVVVCGSVVHRVGCLAVVIVVAM
jgi:hypothetical protein